MTSSYKAPTQDINFLLNEVLNFSDLLHLDGFSSLSFDLIQQILQEGAKFAEEILAPLNHTGDTTHCKLENASVITPPGFKEAYQKFIQNGWNSVGFEEEYGGQNLPYMVSTALSEMFSGANMAFSLCPLLTQGSIELLSKHGSQSQKQQYLPNLVSGQWTGTMCLTEPQAGSDLGSIRCSAIKTNDHYKIKGQKIYITYADHDFTENIIHMVLARTENAPLGIKGISLFIVPKILDNGNKNDINIISLENKLGIHASPTATVEFGENNNCIGYLVGHENEGIKYMFTMMNNARIGVGIQGYAIAYNSFEKAKNYASERVQGKLINDKNGSNVTIDKHPDISRMLQIIEANSFAMRGLALLISKSVDLSKKNDKLSQFHQDIVDILTPVLKSHATEIGFKMSDLAIQIFGGMGYIEETQIAQNLRDSKIAMIYEGTNGIQAQDLVMRKLFINDGRLFKNFLNHIKDAFIDHQEIITRLENSTKIIKQNVKTNPHKIAFVASPYLQLFGIIAGCHIMLETKAKSELLIKNNCDQKSYYQEKLKLAEFYINYIVPETIYLEKIIENNNLFN